MAHDPIYNDIALKLEVANLATRLLQPTELPVMIHVSPFDTYLHGRLLCFSHFTHFVLAALHCTCH